MGGRRILIVEDDTILGRTLVFNMETAGFSVDLADAFAWGSLLAELFRGNWPSLRSSSVIFWTI